MNLETIVIIAIVACAAAFVAVRVVKTLRGKRPACCSGAGAASCPHCTARTEKGGAVR
jgi:hypothetical protein